MPPTKAALPPRVRRLHDSPEGASLAPTLETFLEHGGNVASAAAELFLHRSSLYKRLARIEQLAASTPGRGRTAWRCTSASRCGA